MRIHTTRGGQRNRAASGLLAEENTTMSGMLQVFSFFPKSVPRLCRQWWADASRSPVLAVSGSVPELHPLGQSSSSSLGSLQSLQQHDSAACTNYSLMGPSSITSLLFCQNYFPLLVFSILSVSLPITGGIPYSSLAVTFHHMLLFSEFSSIVIIWDASACSSDVSIKPCSSLCCSHQRLLALRQATRLRVTT